MRQEMMGFGDMAVASAGPYAVCTLHETDNHTNTSSLNFYGPDLFLTPNQQCQSTVGVLMLTVWCLNRSSSCCVWTSSNCSCWYLLTMVRCRRSSTSMPSWVNSTPSSHSWSAAAMCPRAATPRARSAASLNCYCLQLCYTVQPLLASSLD